MTTKEEGEAGKNCLCPTIRKGSGGRGTGSGVRGPGFVYVAYAGLFLGSIAICRWNKLTLPDRATLQLTVSLSYLDFKLDRPLRYPTPLSEADLETVIFSILNTKIVVGCKCSRTVWNVPALLSDFTASSVSEDGSSLMHPSHNLDRH